MACESGVKEAIRVIRLEVHQDLQGVGGKDKGSPGILRQQVFSVRAKPQVERAAPQGWRQLGTREDAVKVLSRPPGLGKSRGGGAREQPRGT